MPLGQSVGLKSQNFVLLSSIASPYYSLFDIFGWNKSVAKRLIAIFFAGAFVRSVTASFVPILLLFVIYFCRVEKRNAFWQWLIGLWMISFCFWSWVEIWKQFFDGKVSSFFYERTIPNSHFFSSDLKVINYIHSSTN